MKRNHLFVAASLVLLVAGAVALAAAGKAQTSCPVSGKAINKSVFVDHQGQRIYFCCADCPAAFKADPEKSYAQFQEDGIELENIQTTCPVSGEKLGEHGEATSVSYKGRTVKFCCAACEKSFAKDPEKYLAMLPGEQF